MKYLIRVRKNRIIITSSALQIQIAKTLNSHMTYSTFIHSSLVNPAKPNIAKESADSVDTVTMDVPLLTRLLELAREDITDDAELHRVLERIIAIKDVSVLTMDNYDEILGKLDQDETSAELESIKKLAGI